jgi:hypothetical protein
MAARLTTLFNSEEALQLSEGDLAATQPWHLPQVLEVAGDGDIGQAAGVKCGT